MTDSAGKYDGWVITEEQAELINRGDGSIWSRIAFELFYWENYKRLRIVAASFLSKWYHKARMQMYDVDDCLNSLYMDGLQGNFRVKLERRYIGGAVMHSYAYMPVGGCEGVPEYKPRKVAT